MLVKHLGDQRFIHLFISYLIYSITHNLSLQQVEKRVTSANQVIILCRPGSVCACVRVWEREAHVTFAGQF